MLKLNNLKARLRNSVESRHGTDYLADCNQCGAKPTRGWSFRGAFLGCECSVLTNGSGGGWGTLEAAWETLQGVNSEQA